jgi:hypothetical protein
MFILAASPFSILRQARIKWETLRRTLRRDISGDQAGRGSTDRCFAHWNPSPVFAPVTMMVWPIRLPVGRGGARRICPPRNWRISEREGMLVVRI